MASKANNPVISANTKPKNANNPVASVKAKPNISDVPVPHLLVFVDHY